MVRMFLCIWFLIIFPEIYFTKDITNDAVLKEPELGVVLTTTIKTTDKTSQKDSTVKIPDTTVRTESTAWSTESTTKHTESSSTDDTGAVEISNLRMELDGTKDKLNTVFTITIAGVIVIGVVLIIVVVFVLFSCIRRSREKRVVTHVSRGTQHHVADNRSQQHQRNKLNDALTADGNKPPYEIFEERLKQEIIKKDVKKDVKTGVEKDVKTGVKKDVKTGVKKGVTKDAKKDVKKDVKELVNIRKKVWQRPQQSPNTDINTKVPQTDKKASPYIDLEPHRKQGDTSANAQIDYENVQKCNGNQSEYDSLGAAYNTNVKSENELADYENIGKERISSSTMSQDKLSDYTSLDAACQKNAKTEEMLADYENVGKDGISLSPTLSGLPTKEPTSAEKKNDIECANVIYMNVPDNAAIFIQ